MSDISIFRRHRGFFWSLSATIVICYLAITDLISLSEIPFALSLTLFVGILTSIGILMMRYQKHGKVIERSKENNMAKIIKRVFYFPMLISILGVIYIFLLEFVTINLKAYISPELANYVSIFSKSALIFLIIYSVISFGECLSFLYRIGIGESGSEIKK